MVEFAKKYRQEGVVGLDLAGAESAATSEHFKHIFEQVQDVDDLHVTIHAGEACGAHSVTDALDNLFAERIGHGYRCLEDEKVLERVIKEQVCGRL